MNSAVHPVDQVLPLRQMLTLGLQHMAVSYIGAIAVPLIVASALKMSQADTVLLISTTLFCCGIATLMQTLGFWKFGVRLPILQGAAFSSVGPVIAIGSNPDVGVAGICGAVIGAGIFTMLVAPWVGRLRRLFPPVVTGCIVTVIGLQLFPIAYEWAGGGRNHSDFGAPGFLLVTLVVLAVILLVTRYGSPLLRNMSVLIGMLVGGGLRAGHGQLPWRGRGALADGAGALPLRRAHLRADPHRHPGGGDDRADGRVHGPVRGHRRHRRAPGGRPPGGRRAARQRPVQRHRRDVRRLPFIAFMENVGLVILTGVRSRWVVAVSGLMMCTVALIPKAGAIIASMPTAALGGAAVAMFGVVAAAGIQTLAKVDYERNRYNVLIVGFTIAAALVPVLSPALFHQLPAWSQPFLHSSVVIACLVSVGLNAALNGVGVPDAANGKTLHDVL